MSDGDGTENSRENNFLKYFMVLEIIPPKKILQTYLGTGMI